MSWSWLRLLSLPALVSGALVAQIPRYGPEHRNLWVEDRADGIAFGDLDGDGDPDAVAGGVHRNDGTGRFVMLAELPGSQAPESVALADFDRDGDLDAVLASVSLSWPWLWRNDGDCRFTLTTPLPPQNARSVAAGDVDGDGRPDVLFGNLAEMGQLGLTGGQNQLFLGQGDGTFVEAPSGYVPVGDDERTWVVVLGDLDGDSDLDALVGNRDTATLLYRNDGTGRFSEDGASNLPPSTDTTAIALGDVDGDGDPDALVAAGSVGLWRNDGSGRFDDVTAAALPQQSGRVYGLALADVDSDGDLDGVLGPSHTYRGDLFLNDGNGRFTRAPAGDLAAIPWVYAVAVADVDGDADLDLGTAPLRLLANDGSGGLTDVTRFDLPLTRDTTVAVAVADVDGNGYADLVAVNDRGPSRLYLDAGDGVGRYRDASAGLLPFVQGGARDVAAGDVDGDGDLDLFVAVNGQDQLLLNDGLGVFTDASVQLPIEVEKGTAVVLEDIDGDSDLDAVVAQSDAVGRVLTNDGQGWFSRWAELTAAANDVTTGDVDGDGDPDLLLATDGGGILFRNDGLGFTDVTQAWLPPNTYLIASLALGDVDTDGDLDVYAACGALWAPFSDMLWHNDGSGTFTEVVGAVPTVNAWTSCARFRDLDGDGDPDLLLIETEVDWDPINGPYVTGYRTRALENTESGWFVEASSALLFDMDFSPRAAELADVDGDGDPDVVFGCEGPEQLWLNHGRQVVWLTAPRVGVPLTLAVSGPAVSPWLLDVALAAVRWPLPFGTLRIDPSSMLATWGGLLGADGLATLTFSVPLDPTLVGLSLHWQAATIGGRSIRLTNLETTRFAPR